MVDSLEVIVNAWVGLLSGLFYGRDCDRNYIYYFELEQLGLEGGIDVAGFVLSAGSTLTKEEASVEVRKKAFYGSLGTAGAMAAAYYFTQPLSSSAVKGIVAGVGFYLGTHVGMLVSTFSRHRARLSPREKNTFEGYIRRIEEMMREKKPEADIDVAQREVEKYTYSLIESKRNNQVARDLKEKVKTSHDYMVRYRLVDRLISQSQASYSYHGKRINDDADALLIHRKRLYHLPIKAELGSVEQQKLKVAVNAHVTGLTSHEIKWDGTIDGVVHASGSYEKAGRTLMWVKGDDAAELASSGLLVLQNYLFEYVKQKRAEYIEMKRLH